jgi:small subunit ribosomal protein S9
MINQIYTGLGKRKTAVARVFLKFGEGKITINGKTHKKFFRSIINQEKILNLPLILVNLTNKYNINIIVKGGGLNGQLEAIKLGLAKAICSIKQDYRTALKKEFLLHRDSRIKERRKYGLKKARKASQYSKR